MGRPSATIRGLRYQGLSLQYCHGPPMCRLAVPRKRSLDKKRGEDCVGSIVWVVHHRWCTAPSAEYPQCLPPRTFSLFPVPTDGALDGSPSVWNNLADERRRHHCGRSESEKRRSVYRVDDKNVPPPVFNVPGPFLPALKRLILRSHKINASVV